MAIEIFASVLVAPVAKFIAGKVFGDRTLGYEIAGGAVDFAREKLGDYKKARDANRKVEDLALSVVEDVAAFAAYENLDVPYMEQIARDILLAINSFSLGDEIAKAGRNP
jgi:hypothetical protein